MGYGPAVNRGLRYITGDYIIVSNNDITLQSGTLRDLPHPKAITVPMIEPMPKDLLPRAIFCMPKQIFSWIMAFGYFYDEDFGLGYWEDDDLIRRLGDTKVIVRENVVVNHLHGGGMTMKKFGEQEWHDRNEKVFKEKWPDTYS